LNSVDLSFDELSVEVLSHNDGNCIQRRIPVPSREK
jgi:hypothetical protein